MSGIHHNRLIQLVRLGKKYEPHSLRKFDDMKKYAILVIYLIDLSQELIDQCIDIHDRQMNFVISKGRKEQDEIQKQNGKSVNEKVINYAALIKALRKAKDEELDPYKTIETTVMSWEALITSGEEADKLARPIDYDYLDLIDCRYNQLRKYTPTLLKCIEFRSTQSFKSVVKALEIIHSINENGKRIIPENAPIDFISTRWGKHVFESDGSINRHYYEMAALTELKNHIRSGNISIVGSRQHKDFDEYLVSKEDWKLANNTGTRLCVRTNVSEYLEERMASLDKRLKWISTNLFKLEGASFEKGKIHVERLQKDVPEDAKSYSASLYSLVPRIKLTDILSDIANITNFHEQFIHASSKQKPDSSEQKILMAALMGIGTNIGLTKMADATPNISYHQMANAAQWRMYDDSINKAQAVLVNYQYKLELFSYWGDGTTSSSDGMRVTTSVPSLYGDTNPHYGFGKGSTIYRFVSDQFSSYHVNVITTNSRDATHVIDGLLHHETDLEIHEHYTDTAGYTDQVFGLCHLLGFQFAPRIRDISDAKLYTILKANDYPPIAELLHRVNIKSIQENFDDILRLSHSIREGSVSASLIMSKIGSYARQNSLATALKEMGYIEKTIFILDYVSSKALRRKINRGLNKGEAMNALARAVFFGKLGEFRDRSIQDQLQKSSALNILLNAISLWNTIYLSKAIEYQKTNGTFREDLLPHISPLGWEHINFLGEFNFDSKIKVSLDSLRPLNIQNP